MKPTLGSRPLSILAVFDSADAFAAIQPAMVFWVGTGLTRHHALQPCARSPDGQTMIVTLTLDPAADQTLWVDRIDPGNVHRVVGHVEIEVLG